MSISSSLSNALSGLNISSRMAETVSSNLANAMTEGYGRRGLEVSSYGGGVKVDGVTRDVDRGIIGDRRIAEARLNADQRSADMLGKIESVIGGPESTDSIATRLTAFEGALVSAATDPASEQRLSQLSSTLGAFVDKLRGDSTQIQKLRQDADATIRNDVDTLNSNLKMLEQVNADISRTTSSGQDPSSLFDARQQIVDEISSIVPVRELDRGSGQIGLITTSGLVLLDGKASQFSFSESPTIVPEMTLASGGLSGISLNGVALNADDGFGKLKGGSLGAAFQMRDDTLVAAQEGLDLIALDIATRFSDPAVDPTAGGMGLLTDEGGAVDSVNQIGLSGRLAINATIDPSQGGSLSNWRDGVGATISGPTGNASQLDRWRSALLGDGGISGMSVSEAIATFSSSMSAERLNAEKELSFSAARWDSLYSAELAGGVDTDAELQNLLRIEQSYAANAKVIQTVSSMLQQLMEI